MDLTLKMFTRTMDISIVTADIISVHQLIADILNVDSQNNLQELIRLVRQAPYEHQGLVIENFQWLMDSIDNDFSDILISPAPFSLLFDKANLVTSTFSCLKTDLLNNFMKYDTSNVNNSGCIEIAHVCWSDEESVSFSWANQYPPICMDQLSLDAARVDIGFESDDLWIKSVKYKGKFPDIEEKPVTFKRHDLNDFYLRVGNKHFEPLINFE